MDAVIGTVRDRTADGNLRMAAMTVLAAYVRPGIGGIHEEDLPLRVVERYGIIWTSHPSQKNGTVPLDDGDIVTILNTLGEVAAGGAADERVSGAAAYVKRSLELMLQRRGSGGA